MSMSKRTRTSQYARKAPSPKRRTHKSPPKIQAMVGKKVVFRVWRYGLYYLGVLVGPSQYTAGAYVVKHAKDDRSYEILSTKGGSFRLATEADIKRFADREQEIRVHTLSGENVEGDDVERRYTKVPVRRAQSSYVPKAHPKPQPKPSKSDMGKAAAAEINKEVKK